MVRLEPVPLGLVVESMQHADRNVVSHARQAFLTHGNEGKQPDAVIRALESWLKQLTNPNVSELHAVVQAYRPHAASLLRKTAREHPVSEMRLFALHELAHLPNEPLDEFVPELRRLAESTEPLEVRTGAIYFLGKMRRAGVPVLRELTGSKDEYARFVSMLRLAQLEHRTVSTDHLIAWFSATSNGSIRLNCITILASRKSEARQTDSALGTAGRRSRTELGSEMGACSSASPVKTRGTRGQREHCVAGSIR